MHPFTSLIATYDATRIPNTITLNSVNEFGGFSANAIEHQMLRRGSDVIVTNVVAFDIKAFDPKAWILSSPTTLGDAEAYEPSDPGYQALLGAGAQVSQGAFVDLFYSRNLTGFPANMASDFSGQTTASSLMMPNINYPAVYDSWRFVPGTGSDGIDNNGDGLIDDFTEMDAAPPYLAPLSGLQVRLRVYDESTRLVKQSTVQHSFK